MAKQKKEPAEGPNGVDRWTSNGYGLVINGKKVEPIPEDEPEEYIEEIEEE